MSVDPTRKTELPAAAGEEPKKLDPVVVVGPGRNVLNKYRSYTYNFTLAALDKQDIKNPASYRDKDNLNYVILKSGGKGFQGFNADAAQGLEVRLNPVVAKDDEGNNLSYVDAGLGKELVNKFNENSPGRFDMFIDDVEIETLMAFTPETNTTMATGLKFDVFEPYSINGFIEALHVSAVSCGYKTYIGASYLLKMEFIGYPDTVGTPEPEKVSNATRYFIVKFKNIDVELTEKGTRYRCECIPFHEGGFGQSNILKAPIKMAGNKVKAILKSFEESLNQQIKEIDKNSKDSKDATKHDVYEIKFADEDWNYEKDENIFSNEDVKQILKERSLYEFADYGNEAEVDDKGRKKPSSDPNVAKTAAGTDPGSVVWEPSKGVVQFPSGSRIHECIAAVIRDSEYVRNIIRNLGEPNTKYIDEYGMVTYFIVDLEVTPTFYDAVNRKEFFKYTYIVAPYKVHYSKIPRYGSQKFDETKFKRRVARFYDYLYSGDNVDLINFKLKFDALFFEAVPRALGNSNYVPSTDALTRANSTEPIDKAENTKNIVNDQVGTPPVQISPKAELIPNIGNASPSLDPYSVLARNMHEAIVNSKVGLVSGDLEIIGDPVYLVTAGHGNYRPKLNKDSKIFTETGEVAYKNGEVLIKVNFKNPSDIGEDGFFKFDNNKVPFGGIYRVLSVRHSFRDGVFKQVLSVQRVPGQIMDQNIEETDPADKSESRPNPLDVPIRDITKAVKPSQRAQGFNILTQLQSAVSGASQYTSSLLSSLTAPLSAAVGKLGQDIASVSSNVTAVTSKVTSALNGVNLQVAQVGEKLGISPQNLANASPLALISLTALAKKIPTGVDLKEAQAQGVNLNFPPSNLPNLPPQQPKTTAPAAEVNQKDLQDLLAAGGLAALASSFGTSSASKIPNSVLPSETVSSLTRDFSRPSLTNPFAQVGSQLSSVDSSIVSGKSLSNLQPVSNSVEVNLKISNASNIENLNNSVTSKLGSKLESPLTKLNDANIR